MDLKDFPNTRAIPLKSLPDRKNMPDLDYDILKPQEKKAQKVEQATITIKCSESAAEETLIPLLEYIQEIGNPGHSFEIVVDPDNNEYKETFEFDGDGVDRIDDISVEYNDGEKKEAQTNINLVDKSAPSVDNDRIETKDRKKHRVRFRNEPDGIREKEFEGLSDYHNVHRTDGEDRYNDPGDPRRGY